jgi:hypothetical protein
LLKSRSKVALSKGDLNLFLSESDETVAKRNVLEISKKVTNKLADLLKESERAAKEYTRAI